MRYSMTVEQRMPLLQTIALLAQRLFTSEETLESKDALSDSLMALINKVTLNMLNVSLPPREAIEYYNIHSSEVLTICVFVMKKGATMPTHDHPNMTVFSKVVSGAIHVKTYEFLPSQAPTPSSESPSAFFQQQQQHHTSPQKLRMAKISIDGVISADMPESLLVIRPDGGPNMHSFTAVSDHVVVLDIIGPPYNDNDRPCIYYKESSLPFSRIGSHVPVLSHVDGSQRMIVKKRKEKSPALNISRQSVDSLSSLFGIEMETEVTQKRPVSTGTLNIPQLSSSFPSLASPVSNASSKRSPPVFNPDFAISSETSTLSDNTTSSSLLTPSESLTGFGSHIGNDMDVETIDFPSLQSPSESAFPSSKFQLHPYHHADPMQPTPSFSFQLQSPSSPCSSSPRHSPRLQHPRYVWLEVDHQVDHECTEMPYDGSKVYSSELQRATAIRDIELLNLVEKVLLIVARMEASAMMASNSGMMDRMARRRVNDVAVNG
ncbi:hypothetical protein HDU97_006270 [Phlyctochytrium planicorne]|nr:hypothetical protein HDU97_006270 [Phlyctochytrium planicorne]